MAPKPGKRRVLRLVLRALGILVGLYALLLVAVILFQRSFIYFPQRLEGPIRRSTSPSEEFVTFPSGDGTRISGLFVHPSDDGAPVVFVTHGNAGNVLTWRSFLDPFTRRGFGAFLLDPRGYGWSEGSPTEDGSHEDARAGMEWLASRGFGESRIIVVGVSIGSGLAVPLAADRPVRALILQSPFASLVDVAAEHYPFVPWDLVLRDRYDNAAAAPRVRCPVLILHGTADRIVPVAHGRRLAAAFSPAPTLRLVEGGDHNDLGRWPGYDAALQEFLDTLR